MSTPSILFSYKLLFTLFKLQGEQICTIPPCSIQSQLQFSPDHIVCMCFIFASDTQCIPVSDCIIFHLSYTLLGQLGTIIQNGVVTLDGNNVSLNITVTLPMT